MKGILRFVRLGFSSSRVLRCRKELLMWIAPVVFLSFAHGQGKGLVEGRLVNGTDPSLVGAAVDLDVIGFAGGMSILKSAVTDSAGRFRIDGLPTDSPLMIRANYKSVNYHGQFKFDPSGKATVEIQVFEPTTSMKGIQLQAVRMAFQLDGDRLRSLESYSFRNETKPPRSFMSPDGNLRISKAPGLLEPPRMEVTGPGAMPLAQSPLESPDGQSYYSLYPLRPGETNFEVQQALPYRDGTYSYRKKFYQDVGSLEIGVIPRDMELSGAGLAKVQTDSQRNFAVYSAGPIKAGTEVVWTFSGGTPPSEPMPAETGGESKVQPMPTSVGANAFIIGPLLLVGFIMVLWYASSLLQARPAQSRDPRSRALRERREQLLNYLASLDCRYEQQLLERRQYLREREQGKRQVRRIALLLKKD